MSRKFSISIVTETSKRTNRRSYSDIPSASNSPGVKNANRARFFASRIRGLSRPPLPSPDRFPRRGFEFRGSCGGGGEGKEGGGDKNLVELCRSRVDEFPTEFSPSRRSRCSLLFRPKDFLSEWRMDEIATLLDRARARAGVGYPGVFYFACRPRCYLAPLH